jgi:hypothetical protein
VALGNISIGMIAPVNMPGRSFELLLPESTVQGVTASTIFSFNKTVPIDVSEASNALEAEILKDYIDNIKRSYSMQEKRLLRPREEVDGLVEDIRQMVTRGEILTVGAIIDSFQISGFSSRSLNPGIMGLPNFAAFGVVIFDMSFSSPFRTTNVSGTLVTSTDSAPFTRLSSFSISVLSTEPWSLTSGLVIPLFGFSVSLTTDPYLGRRYSGSVQGTVMLQNTFTIGVFVPFNIPNKKIEVFLPPIALDGADIRTLFGLASAPMLTADDLPGLSDEVVKAALLQKALEDALAEEQAFAASKTFLLTSGDTLSLRNQQLRNVSALRVGLLVDSLNIAGFTSANLNPGLQGLPNFAAFAVVQFELEFMRNSSGLNHMSLAVMSTLPWTVVGSLSVPFFMFGVTVTRQYDVFGRPTDLRFSGFVQGSLSLGVYVFGAYVPFNIPGRQMQLLVPDLLIQSTNLEVLLGMPQPIQLPDLKDVDPELAAATRRRLETEANQAAAEQEASLRLRTSEEINRQTVDVQRLLTDAVRTGSVLTIGSFISNAGVDLNLPTNVPALPPIASFAFTRMNLELNASRVLSADVVVMSTSEWVIIPFKTLPSGSRDPASGLSLPLFAMNLKATRVNGTLSFSLLVKGRVSISSVVVLISVPYRIPGLSTEFVVPDAKVNNEFLSDTFDPATPFTEEMIPKSLASYDLLVDQLGDVSGKLLTLGSVLAMLPSVDMSTLNSLPSPLDGLLQLALVKFQIDLGTQLNSVISLNTTIVATKPLVFTEDLVIPMFGAGIRYSKGKWSCRVKGIVRLSTAIFGVDAPYGVPSAVCRLVIPKILIGSSPLDALIENVTTVEELPNTTAISQSLTTALKLSDVIDVLSLDVDLNALSVASLPDPAGFAILLTEVSFGVNVSDFKVAEFKVASLLPWVVVPPSQSGRGLTVNSFSLYLRVVRVTTDAVGNPLDLPVMIYAGRIFGSFALNNKIVRVFYPFKLPGETPRIIFPATVVGSVDLKNLNTDPATT